MLFQMLGGNNIQIRLESWRAQVHGHKIQCIVVSTRRRAWDGIIGQAMSVYDRATLCNCASNTNIKHTKTTTEAEGKTWCYDFVRLPMATAYSQLNVSFRE